MKGIESDEFSGCRPVGVTESLLAVLDEGSPTLDDMAFVDFDRLSRRVPVPLGKAVGASYDAKGSEVKDSEPRVSETGPLGDMVDSEGSAKTGVTAVESDADTRAPEDSNVDSVVAPEELGVDISPPG